MESIRNGRPARLEFLCGRTDLPDRIMEQPMLDIVLLSAGIGIFAVAVLYTIACERM